MPHVEDSKFKNEWFEMIKAIIITIILAILIQSFVFSTSVVEGDSMEPTLNSGDRILFNKFIYLWNKPLREDIVIIEQANKNYVKRIIALPEETIEIRNHTLYIDGEPYEQNYLPEKAIQRTGNFGPIAVPEDHYFVMGDNRAISKDSRNGLGFIEEKHIIGRSEFIIYPFSEWQMTR